jgi:hypothetical protein
MSFEDSDLHLQAEDNYPSKKKENSYKLTCLENTENIKTKTERETKIKSLRASCNYSAEESRCKHKTNLERDPYLQLLQGK